MTARRAQLQSPPEFDPYRRFVESVPHMVTMSRSALRESYSYRDFKVGASVLAVDATQEFGFSMSGNLKITRNRSKVCAERIALDKAKKSGFEYAVGMVVAATTDPVKIEEVTEVPTPTLHCCGECLGMFVGYPLMRRETLIVTVGDDEDAFQVMTSGSMGDLYTLDPEGIAEQPKRFGFNDWDLHVQAYDQLVASRTGEGIIRSHDLAEMARTAILYPVSSLGQPQ